jgi:hypothetical protein
MAQLWPGETKVPRPRTLISLMRIVYYRVRWWRPMQRLIGVDLLGWWWPLPTGETEDERFFSWRRRDTPR